MQGQVPPGLHDELDAYLEAVKRDDAYQVIETLGSSVDSGCSATELVRFVGPAGATLGPFVRKRIDLATHLGSAYETLAHLAREGMRFQHLPRVIDCYKTQTQLVVVLEYVPGATLAQTVGERGASLALARTVFPQMCDAADELHRAVTPPIIHRDLTPRNVIVAPRGIFLIDLGIARQYRDGAAADTQRFGTRPYAPPEQYGFGQTGVRSDVYALGVLLWFCLTGVDPLGHLDTMELERAGIPAPLAAVIARATAIDPAARYASARDVRDSFERACAAVSAEREGDGSHDAASSGEEDGPSRTTSPREDQASARAAASSAHTSHKHGNSKAKEPNLWKVRVKNLLLVVLAIAVLPAAVRGIQNPTGTNVGKPLWYLVALYALLIIPFFLGPMYFALDKTGLYRRFPRLSARTLRDDLRLWGMILLINFCVMVLINLATNV